MKPFMTSLLYIFAALSSFAQAGDIQITSPTALTMNLAEKQVLTVKVTASEAIETDLSVEAGHLAQSFGTQDISASVAPTHLSLAAGQTAELQVQVETRSSSPSFQAKSFDLVFVNSKNSGSVVLRAPIELTVKAVYIVDVIDGSHGMQFDFNTPANTEQNPTYFRVHPEGLQFIFRNLSSNPCVIHGEGSVEHQPIDEQLGDFKPLPASHLENGERVVDAQGTYVPALIKVAGGYEGSDGHDVAGAYTIHNVYKPYRYVVVNATKIPDVR